MTNNKVYVLFTNSTDGKNYVVKLDIALKKAKTYASSTEDIDEFGSQNKEDYWSEDYTNEGGDTRYIKIYKI